jgi:hypothetical protein
MTGSGDRCKRRTHWHCAAGAQRPSGTSALFGCSGSPLPFARMSVPMNDTDDNNDVGLYSIENGVWETMDQRSSQVSVHNN